MKLDLYCPYKLLSFSISIPDVSSVLQPYSPSEVHTISGRLRVLHRFPYCVFEAQSQRIQYRGVDTGFLGTMCMI
jgi:hypothetical protein